MDSTSQRFLMGASAGGVSYWLNLIEFSPIISLDAGWRCGLDSTTEDFYYGSQCYNNTLSKYTDIIIKTDIDGNNVWSREITNTLGLSGYGGVLSNDDAGFYGNGFFNKTGWQAAYYCYILANGTFSVEGGTHRSGSSGFYSYGISLDTYPSGDSDKAFLAGFSYNQQATLIRAQMRPSFTWLNQTAASQQNTWCRGVRYSPNDSNVWTASDYSSSYQSVEINGFLPSNLAVVHSTAIQAYATTRNISGAFCINVNNAGNPVWGGLQQSAVGGIQSMAVAEVNASSAGNLVRTAAFSVPGTGSTQNHFNNVYDVAIDASDNYYFVGFFYTNQGGGPTTGYGVGFVCKLDSSFTQQWVNILYDTRPAGVKISSILLAKDGSLMVCGNAGARGFSAKLDPDGGGTGTYGDLVYQSYSFNTETSVMTGSSGFVSWSGGGEGTVTPGATASSITGTETVYDLT